MTAADLPTKRCSGCDKVQQLEAFHRDRSSVDGRHSRCRTCRAEYDARRYLTDREVILSRNAAWKAANPERAREYQSRTRARARAADRSPDRAAPTPETELMSKRLRRAAALLLDAAAELEAATR